MKIDKQKQISGKWFWVYGCFEKNLFCAGITLGWFAVSASWIKDSSRPWLESGLFFSCGPIDNRGTGGGNMFKHNFKLVPRKAWLTA